MPQNSANLTMQELAKAHEDVIITNPNVVEEEKSKELCTDVPTDSGDVSGKQEDKPTAKVPILNRIKGVSLFVFASFMATCHGGVVKHMKILPSGEVVVISCFYAACFLAILITFQGHSFVDFPRKKWVFLRCVGGSGALLCKVWSVQNLPLGNATALVFTSPIITCVLARVVLKEKINLFHIFAILAGLAGIILIARPTFIFPSDEAEDYPLWYNIVPLIAAFSLSMAYVSQRYIGSVVNCFVVSFYGVTCQTLAGIILQAATQSSYINPSCYSFRGMLLFLSFTMAAVFLSVNKGLSYEKAATVSLIRNLDTVLAFVLQVVVFKEAAETFSLIGAALIMIGTISLTLSKMFGVDCGVKF